MTVPIRGAASNQIVNDLILILWMFGGAAAGYSLPRLQNRGLRIARWTWVLPSSFFVGVFAWEWADFGRAAALAAFFNPSEAAGGQGGEGMAALFFTIPAASALLYSIGAVVGYAGRRDKGEPGRKGQSESTHS